MVSRFCLVISWLMHAVLWYASWCVSRIHDAVCSLMLCFLMLLRLHLSRCFPTMMLLMFRHGVVFNVVCFLVLPWCCVFLGVALFMLLLSLRLCVSWCCLVHAAVHGYCALVLSLMVCCLAHAVVVADRTWFHRANKATEPQSHRANDKTDANGGRRAGPARGLRMPTAMATWVLCRSNQALASVKSSTTYANWTAH